MSEQQSPEKTADPFGDTNVASMEDILASIRSMIADDEAPGEPELVAPPPAAKSIDIAPDMAVSQAVEPVAVPDVTEEDTTAAIHSISMDMLDIDSLFDGEDLALDVDLASKETVAAAEPVELPGEEDMDLVKSLMAELSEAPDDAVLEPLAVEAPTEAPVAELPVDEPVLELDDAWLSGELTIPESVETAPVVATNGSPDIEGPDTGSMLDEILLGSLDGEDVLREADTAAAESEDGGDAIESSIEPPAASSNIVSLSDIAAQAEREAEDLAASPAAVDYPSALEDTLPDTDTPAELQTADAFAEDIMDDIVPMEDLIASQPADEPDDDVARAHEAPPSAPETEAELAQALEEEVMARTAPLEEIIDDEVEVEASNAFAKLNRLVEEKSVVEERGPRIGDLVQEALKPMLKEWLDENLKGIVERAVQKEVKRISSGK